ncbi:MAG TPA: c-type cytochrome domain-containing protein, partial [Pirellulales bacterium]|nr:c-type cytochrome domain-containing protein [Pirellulales bacterium]
MFGQRLFISTSYAMLAVALVGICRAAAPQQAASGSADLKAVQPVDFDHDIRPIFSKRCYSCHSAEQAEASLRLDRRGDALKGGNSGPAIKPGHSGESRLVAYITGSSEDELIMPPEGERLSSTEVALIKHWIDQGAVWPEEKSGARRGRGHWSYQPISHPRLPAVRRGGWVRNPIDAFVLARLESLGIEPSPEADRVTL